VQPSLVSVGCAILALYLPFASYNSESIRQAPGSENDPKVKTTIIQKVVEKIIIKNEEVEIYFYVGERHYKRELDLSGSRSPVFTKALKKRHTSPLPVFHGNLETAQILNLKPKDIYDAGSNSLKNGRECGD